MYALTFSASPWKFVSKIRGRGHTCLELLAGNRALSVWHKKQNRFTT